eukprot:s1891_g10.t1
MEAAIEGAGKTQEKKKKKKKGPREFDWTKATFGHYVLKLAYVGTNYHGLAWQEPSTCPTVEAALFDALQKTRLIQDRQSCNFSRCGRTDKGVHAAGNYISLTLRLKPASESGTEAFDYPSILNGVLPSDIRILAAAPAPSGFDARFSCLFRAYQYYFPHAGEDLQKMREAAAYFVGEHDFRNFCKMDVENITNYRRRVLSVSVRPMTDGVAEFAVTGVAFLWHQVRCMAAVLLLVGQGLEQPSVVQELLDVERYPRKPLYEPADESGLVLRDCGFEDVDFAPSSPKSAGESGLPTPSSAAAPWLIASSVEVLDDAGLCMDCPSGQFSADGRQCTKCWNAESDACADCPAGTAVSDDGTHCGPESTIFYLQNPRSGLCAQVYVSQDYSIRMEQCGRESEVWYFRNGQFRSVSSQFCLNVNGNPGMENGLGTSAWHCEPSGAFHTDQAWQLDGGPIVQKLSGRCLTVRGGQTESGTPLVLYDCAERQEANLSGQYWHFLPACEDRDGPPGVYKVCPSISCPNTRIPDFDAGVCVDCPLHAFSDGLRCKTCAGHQYWNLEDMACSDCPDAMVATEDRLSCVRRTIAGLTELGWAVVGTSLAAFSLLLAASGRLYFFLHSRLRPKPDFAPAPHTVLSVETVKEEYSPDVKQDQDMVEVIF